MNHYSVTFSQLYQPSYLTSPILFRYRVLSTRTFLCLSLRTSFSFPKRSFSATRVSFTGAKPPFISSLAKPLSKPPLSSNHPFLLNKPSSSIQKPSLLKANILDENVPEKPTITSTYQSQKPKDNNIFITEKYKDAIAIQTTQKHGHVTYNGKTYKGNNIDCSMSTEILHKEAIIRELLKEDKNTKKVDIELNDNTIAIMGTSNLGVKVTPLIMSYYSKIIHEPKFVEINVNNSFPKEPVWDIAAPINVCEKTIQHGLTKHLIVILYDTSGNMYTLGYLTSKNNAEFFHDIQVKPFQDNLKKDETFIQAQPTQKIHYMPHLFLVNKDQFKPIKQGQTYMNHISISGKTKLQEHFSNIKDKSVETFQGHGFNDFNLILIMKHYDKIASSGGKLKHPLSEQQSQASKEKKELDKKNKDVSEIKKTHE